MSQRKTRGASDPVTLTINNGTVATMDYVVVGLPGSGSGSGSGRAVASGVLAADDASGSPPSTSLSVSGYPTWSVAFEIDSGHLDTVRFQGDASITLEIVVES